MPSMLEEMTSSNNIDFMERSMANSSVPGKERGAMVHGAPFTGLTYALAFSTGEGQNNAEDDIRVDDVDTRSEEHTSELQSLMRISYAVFCLNKKKQTYDKT